MEFQGVISKTDPDKGRVYGWAYVVSKDGEPVVDHSGDVIDSDDAKAVLEEAFVKYVLQHRAGDLDHRSFGVSSLIEAVYMDAAKRQAMGVEGDTDGLWVGYQINKDTPEGARAWELVKKGERLAFSIVGTGSREVIDA